LVFHYGTRQLVDTAHARTELDVLEQSFRRLHGGIHGSLAGAAEELRKDLQHRNQHLQNVQGILDGRVRVPAILAGVHIPLPEQVQVVRLEVDRSRRLLQMDLAMPDASADKMVDARTLVEAWNAQPLLNGELSKLRIVTRNTQRAGDRSVVIMRVEGELAAGKGT
jgi:hypothetical protein